MAVCIILHCTIILDIFYSIIDNWNQLFDV